VNIGRLTLIGVIFAAWQFVNGQTMPGNRADLSNQAGRNQDMLLRDLGPILKAIGVVGRVYIHSKCLGDSQDVLFFPALEVKSRRIGKAGPAAIQEALAKNKNVEVGLRRPGIIGISFGNVSNDLLRTKIHTLRFGLPQRYNYQKAIAAIIDTEEVQRKMREVRIEAAPVLAIYPIVGADPKLPHLSASMTDLTMDEALDRVAKTFGGLVIYEECQGQGSTRLFSVVMHEM
jgi:hypothetical protein